MGLDFNHRTADNDVSYCCPHWSYSGFNRFRTQLAQAEGHVLEDLWRGEETTNSLLWPLLNHSDCDGELTPAECAQIAPRLREVAAGLDDDYDRQAGLALAACMDACAASGENLEFC